MRPILLLPVLFVSPAADAPKLVHTEGQSITRSWSLQSTRATDTATMSLMGNDQDVGSGSTRTAGQVIEVTDDVTKAADGRAVAFHRVYDSVTSESETEGFNESEGMQLRESSGSSELEQLGVLFTLEDGDWIREFDEDSTGDGDWLEELAADMDLASLLPTDDDGAAIEVEEGDEWELESAVLDDLLRPGGTVQIDPEADTDAPEGGIAITLPNAADYANWDDVDGDITATYAELVEDDGKRLAKIVIAVDLDGEVDIADALEAASADREMEEIYDDAVIMRELTGEIVVMWNLGANRPESVSGQLEGADETSIQWTLMAGNNELEIGYEAEVSTSFKLSATWSE